jgi:hypothetical protein
MDLFERGDNCRTELCTGVVADLEKRLGRRTTPLCTAGCYLPPRQRRLPARADAPARGAKAEAETSSPVTPEASESEKTTDVQVERD